MFSRHFLTANAVALSALFLAIYFPASGSLELSLLATSALVFFPLIAIRFLIRTPFSQYGISIGNRHIAINIGITLASIACAALLALIFITKTDIGKTVFTIPAPLRESFLLFLIHTGITAWSIAINEFFFRGFILFSWESISKRAGVLASILFVAGYSLLSTLHNSTPFSWGLFCTTLFFACGASIVASFTRSILFSFCFSFVSGILATAFAILFA